MSNGYTTSDLTPMELADEVLVNRSGSSGRQKISALATQLAGSGPLAQEIAARLTMANLAPIQQDIAAIETAIGVLQASAYAEAPLFDTTAAGISATSEGDLFKVPGTGDVAFVLYRHGLGDAATMVYEMPTPGALAAKADAAVVGAASRVYDDGRFNRSGVDLAVTGAGRRPIWSVKGGVITVHLPLSASLSDDLRATMTGGATWLADGRWARCGREAMIIGSDRRIILDLTKQPARLADVTSAVEASAAQLRAERSAWIPWSDGSEVYCDNASSGQSVRLSSGGGVNINPSLVGDVVIWSADRADNLPYKPAAPGGRYYSRPDKSDEHPVIPIPIMACWGDSTTAQGWPACLADVGWGIRALNFGRSSNTALGIASRYGAIETSYDCPDIPGGGAEVVCAASATSEGKPMQSWADASGSINGWIVADRDADPESGTYVTVRWDKTAGAYYIKRYAVGPTLTTGKYYFHAAPIPTADSAWDDPPTSDMVWNHRDMILALWIGRNSYTNPQLVFEMTQKIVAHHAPLSKRMILMPWLNGNGEGIGTAAYAYREQALALFREAWPDNTLDLLPHFIASASASAEDQAAVAANYPPPSRMTDNVHPNAAGRLIVAQAVYDFSNAKGWV